MRAPSGEPKARRRLFLRIYLYGLLLIAAVGAALTAVAFLLDAEGRPHWRPERLARFAAVELAPAAADRSRLQAELDRLHSVLDADMAVYRRDGIALAVAGSAPPPPLSPRRARRVGERAVFRQARSRSVAVPLGGPDSPYLLVARRSLLWPTRFLITVGAILIALALVSWPAARGIARPLERLTSTSRTLARGDLTARTGMDRDDEVGALAQAIDDMAARLEHRIRAEKELLADISHELRTPLARIRVALELCAEEEGGVEAVKSHLEGITGDVADLDRLLEEVLTTVRLDLAASTDPSAGLAVRKVATRLEELAQGAAERFAAAHPRHRLRVEMPANLPPFSADPRLLRRVLDNLLDNASKYSDPGEPVVLGAAAEEEWIVGEVRDRGIGVDEEDLPRLFEPFFRTDRSRSRAGGGAGLGLALCKRIVDAHGGGIEAIQNPGGGTIIRFRLPIRPPEPPSVSPGAGPTAQA